MNANAFFEKEEHFPIMKNYQENIIFNILIHMSQKITCVVWHLARNWLHLPRKHVLGIAVRACKWKPEQLMQGKNLKKSREKITSLYSRWYSVWYCMTKLLMTVQTKVILN